MRITFGNGCFQPPYGSNSREAERLKNSMTFLKFINCGQWEDGIRSKFESNEELKNRIEVSTASSEGRNAKLSFQLFTFGKGH